MCGRFALSPQTGDIEKLVPGLRVEVDIPPRYNIAPTQDAASILNDDQKAVSYLRWGLIPFWAKDPAIGNRMINARAETVTEKPAYKGPFKKKRCLVLATGYYEWKKEAGSKRKIPYFIRLKSQKPFTFAGLWDNWTDENGKDVQSCTLITTEANDVTSEIHHRMPVIISPEARMDWLDSVAADVEKLSSLLVPYEEEPMEAYEVSALVNNPGNDTPECIKPVDG